jgi:hypothetical protein
MCDSRGTMVTVTTDIAVTPILQALFAKIMQYIQYTCYAHQCKIFTSY